MLQLVVDPDPVAFAASVSGFLEQREAESSLFLGILASLEKGSSGPSRQSDLEFRSTRSLAIDRWGMPENYSFGSVHAPRS